MWRNLLILFPLLAYSWVHATSFGRQETAAIRSVKGSPGICLSEETKDRFPVGWVALSESYIKNPGGWSLVLKEGVSPLILNAGECLVYGEIPDGYKLARYKVVVPGLKLQKDRTYVFSINSSDYPRDSYRVVFCVSENSDGSRDYLPYRRLSDGSELVPSCDSRLNRSY
ncbi:hypothetical protein ACQCLI_13770 [Pseudomonas nitroreducens]|uniref:hypothetical protein n=1 Tax=Pseudomonas nitroreducens TaxID=46680 RepID=UPI0012FD9E87|nr:hypothetical protein [Pseudomonas nitroreducens]